MTLQQVIICTKSSWSALVDRGSPPSRLETQRAKLLPVGGSRIDASHSLLVVTSEKDGHQKESLEGDVHLSRWKLPPACHYSHLGTHSIYFQPHGLHERPWSAEKVQEMPCDQSQSRP